MFVDWLLEFGGLVVMAVLFGAWALNIAIFSRLRTRHTGLWRELGEPRVVPGSMRDSWRYFGFVWSGRHSGLADRRLSRLVLSLRVASLLCWGLLLVLVVLGLMNPDGPTADL